MDNEFDKGWEHEPKDRPLFINLHKLMFPTTNNYANQLSIFFMHIYVGLINHVIMEAYNEYWGTNVHSECTFHSDILSNGPKSFQRT